MFTKQNVGFERVCANPIAKALISVTRNVTWLIHHSLWRATLVVEDFLVQ